MTETESLLLNEEEEGGDDEYGGMSEAMYQAIVHFKRTGEYPDFADQRTNRNAHFHWRMRCANYILSENGEGETLLYYNPNSNMEPKVVVKKGEVRLAIKIIHERLAHPGQKATHIAVSRRLYWRSVRRDTIRFVFDCAVCNKKKEMKNRSRQMPSYTPAIPKQAELSMVEADVEEGEAFVAERLMLNEDQLTHEVELVDAVMRNERAMYSSGKRNRRAPMYRFADEIDGYGDDDYMDGDDAQLLDDDDEEAMREAEYLEQISDPGDEPTNGEENPSMAAGHHGGRKREAPEEETQVVITSTGRGSPKRTRVMAPPAPPPLPTRITTRSRASLATSPSVASSANTSIDNDASSLNPPKPNVTSTRLTPTASSVQTPRMSAGGGGSGSIPQRDPPSTSLPAASSSSMSAIRRPMPTTRPGPARSGLNGSTMTGRFSGVDSASLSLSSSPGHNQTPLVQHHLPSNHPTYHQITGGDKYAYADTTLGAAVLMHPTDREVVRLQKQVLVLQKQVLMLQRQHLRQKIEHYAFFQSNQQLQLVEEQVEDGGEIVTTAHGSAINQQQQQQHHQQDQTAVQNLLSAASQSAEMVNVEE